MKNNFTNICLYISLCRVNSNQIRMLISSDYSRSARKSSLHVNEKSLSEEVLNFWRSIKTKKLLSIHVSFGEIDYYDSMTDMYDVPNFYIERGLRETRIGHNTHGCIPKDWSFDFGSTFADTKVITPLIEVIKSALGSFFTESHEKEFTKLARPFLQGKINNVSYDFGKNPIY